MQTVAERNAAREAAYDRGEYRFRAPPVCTAFWDRRSWMKYVTFNDARLNVNKIQELDQ